MIHILSPSQQLYLHELSFRKKLPVKRLGVPGPRNVIMPALIGNTKMLEKFTGVDGNDWVRLTQHGRAFVEATAK